MPATIFSGNNVKALKSNLDLNGVTKILSVNADPASGAGVAAPLGSIAMDYLAGKVYKKTGSLDTEWQELGSGIGGINYIENSDAESGTSGWSTYADAAGSAPVDGTGGTANITWSRSTTSPLRGVADFNLVKDAVNRQGQGVSYDFTIDSADQAKILTISADYEVLSGTFATGDLAVYVIQDPAGTPVVLQPAGYQVTAATIGNKVRLAATFQTASNVTSYRLCIHVASVSALAYTLAFDSIAVSPQQVVYGAPVTDWQSYTPTFTGFGTVATQTFWWRRVGDSVEIKGRFVSGTSTATEARVSLPSITSAGSDRIATIEIAGVAEINTIGGVGQNVGVSLAVLAEQSVGYVTFSARSSANTGLTKLQGTGIIASGSVMTLEAKLPITGWSSSVVVSSSTDTRVVAAKAAKTAVQSIPNNSLTKVTLSSSIFDTHSGFDFVNSRYVIQVPGIYRVSALVAWGNTPAGARSLRVYKNGSVDSELYNTIASSATGIRLNGSITVSCVAGDYLEIYAFQDSGGALNIDGTIGSAFNYFSVERLSGPSQIAASESVIASASASTGLVVADNTSVKFDSIQLNTHGAYSAVSGQFTAPIPGTYEISAQLYAGAANRSFVVFKNATVYRGVAYSVGSTATGVTIPLVVLVPLLAGETIEIRNASGTSATLAASNFTGATIANTNYVQIKRIGN